jgi:hypothetical protein
LVLKIKKSAAAGHEAKSISSSLANFTWQILRFGNYLKHMANKKIVSSMVWQICSLFGWLVADGWCWFVLREEYYWLVLAGCWWLVCSERKVLLAGG